MLFDGHLHFRDVTQWVPVVEDTQNFAFFANEKTNPAGQIALGHAYAIGVGGLAFDVGEEGEGKVKFLCKPLMAGDGITANTNDLHPFLDERADPITESAGLFGAAGGVVFRVKIHQHRLHCGARKGVFEIPRFIGLIVHYDHRSQAASLQNFSGRGIESHQ